MSKPFRLDKTKLLPSILPIVTWAISPIKTNAYSVIIQPTHLTKTESIKRTMVSLISSVKLSKKTDVLLMLFSVSTIPSLFQKLKLSPILGYLLSGILLGPSCFNLLSNHHFIEKIGELGIIIFLFEMGLELSFKKLTEMKHDVFALGSSQFLATAAAIAWFSRGCLGLTTPAAVSLGSALAVSSSAFVLQLLKEKKSLDNTRYGQASLGVLLLQDIAVVPLLVAINILGQGKGNISKALTLAMTKAVIAFIGLVITGRQSFGYLFQVIRNHSNQVLTNESFLSLVLFSLLSMSFITQHIGLSDTLGAFIAGLVLAEMKEHKAIEALIAPIRGLFLAIFFIAIGMQINIPYFIHNVKPILISLSLLLFIKSSILTLLSISVGRMQLKDSAMTGLLNAQGGEFAFVALALAERLGLLSPEIASTGVSTVALSMALTPALAKVGDHLYTWLHNREQSMDKKE